MYRSSPKGNEIPCLIRNVQSQSLPSTSKTPYLRLTLFKVGFLMGFSLNKVFSFKGFSIKWDDFLT